jgi:hypothetical protein
LEEEHVVFDVFGLAAAVWRAGVFPVDVDAVVAWDDEVWTSVEEISLKG